MQIMIEIARIVGWQALDRAHKFRERFAPMRLGRMFFRFQQLMQLGIDGLQLSLGSSAIISWVLMIDGGGRKFSR